MDELKKLEEIAREYMSGQSPEDIQELLKLHVQSELFETNEYLQENLSEMSFETSTKWLGRIKKLSQIANVLAKISNRPTPKPDLLQQRDIFLAMKHAKEMFMLELSIVRSNRLPESESMEITEMKLIPYNMLELYLKDRIDREIFSTQEFRDLIQTLK